MNDDHHIDPIRFLDMTYPQVMCILTRGKAAEEVGDVGLRAKRVLADFKSGKYKSG
jgi:hypothetical protein